MNPVNDIQTVCEITAKQGVPWSWVFREEYLTSEIQQFLAAHHIHSTDQSVAMIHTLDIQKDEFNNFDLNLDIGEDLGDLREGARPLRAAFKSSLIVARQYHEVHLKAQKNRICFIIL